MIAIIRIKGEVGLKREIVETLNRLRLKRKYSCVVFAKPTKIQLGMINKVKNFIAFGEIDKKTFEKLLESRGQLLDKTKKIDVSKVIEELEKSSDALTYKKLNLKPFFRLHPPRGGIESKKHFGVGKGVLGNHKDKINELIERML